ncbi:hypothetical protein PENCOP_c017G01681 [Penicillium coprophilum]|uniref:Nephrocystin 3-like N-terminal domain-containing protein n=1 Tax=Penicillium coprophilum TaxID=36646 RepID=A0A1V6U823_9EURO|nr:hypothetical protein PENCOP_c017G01681 [Penicillium coprophilum]
MLRRLLLAESSLLSDSVLAHSDSEEVICVLDALDECQEEERKQLVEAIKALYLSKKSNHKLKVLDK